MRKKQPFFAHPIFWLTLLLMIVFVAARFRKPSFSGAIEVPTTVLEKLDQKNSTMDSSFSEENEELSLPEDEKEIEEEIEEEVEIQENKTEINRTPDMIQQKESYVKVPETNQDLNKKPIKKPVQSDSSISNKNPSPPVKPNKKPHEKPALPETSKSVTSKPDSGSSDSTEESPSIDSSKPSTENSTKPGSEDSSGSYEEPEGNESSSETSLDSSKDSEG